MAEALAAGRLLDAANRRRRRSEAWAAWGLAGPATFLLFLLLLGPTAAVIALSTTDWQLGAKSLRFVGLGNYAEMFSDRVFRQSLANTLLYVAITVPVSVWQGAQDRMVPFSHGKWLAANIPGATVHLDDDQGHLSLWGRIGEILDELRPASP